MPPAAPPGPMGAGPMGPGMQPGPGMPPGMPGMPPGMAAGTAPGYGPGAVVLDVGGTDGKKAAIGAAVAGIVGLIALISGITGAVDGGVGIGVAMVVVGALFMIPAVFVIARRNKIFRPRKLVFEPAGVRWDDPQGAPWAIPWSELAHVSINKHTAAETPESVQDKIVGAAVEKMTGERAMVRLDLYPADPSFAGRHPELAHLWERQGVQGGYRMPLGSNPSFIPLIAQAMSRFAPQLYRGVNATSGVLGLS
jgi:hypothetical protein